MDKNTWVIIGATSAIAEQFAHIAAQNRHTLLLVARNKKRLESIAADIEIRYSVHCTIYVSDLSTNTARLAEKINSIALANLFIAASDIVENSDLDYQSIERSLRVNCISLVQIIQMYWQKNQANHRLIFLSSVAACRGRALNSFYAGTKAAIEVYLQGLQQQATQQQTITIARLGYIDTVQTYGKPGIFYASPPKNCAKACWEASHRSKKQLYYPFFWRYIMAIVSYLPFFLFKRI